MPITSTILVSAIITNSNGEYLFIRHPIRGWEPPGGHVEENEDLPSAVMREVLEETGLEIRVGLLMGLYQGIQSASKLLIVFSGRVVGGQVKTSDESLEVAWFTAEQAFNFIEQPGTLARFKELHTFDGRVRYHSFTSFPNETPQRYKVHTKLY